ncbi:MAG: hypothetical protein RL077_2439 [Verrucomicrobiota bacterium]
MLGRPTSAGMSVALSMDVQVRRGAELHERWHREPEAIAGSLKREHFNLPVIPTSHQSILPDVDLDDRGDGRLIVSRYSPASGRNWVLSGAFDF